MAKKNIFFPVRGTLLLSMTSVFLSGCTSKLIVCDTLESARDKKVEGWVPLEGGAIRWKTDPGGLRHSRYFEVLLEREEVPLFRVRDAVVTRKTTVRPYEGPHQTEEERRLGRDILYIFGIILMPVVVVSLPIIGILILTRGMPDSYYGAPVTTTTRINLDEGVVRGDSSTKEWRGVPSITVSAGPGDRDRFSLCTDSDGRLRIDLLPWCKAIQSGAGELRFVLRADLEGASEHHVSISPEDVSRVLEVAK